MNEFVQLKEEEIRRLLEGQVDVLTPLIRQEEAFLKGRICPKCGAGGCQPFVNPKRPFVQGDPLPKKLMQCVSCSCEFDPYTGIITRASD